MYFVMGNYEGKEARKEGAHKLADILNYLINEHSQQLRITVKINRDESPREFGFWTMIQIIKIIKYGFPSLAFKFFKYLIQVY
jgi:hypothetical protein